MTWRLAGELEGELARIDAVADDLRGELDGIVLAASGDAPDDEHDVEGSSIGFERARVAALLHATEQRRAAVEATLAQLGDHGEVCCASCGKPIAAERMLAVPGVTTCVACAGRHRPAGR